MRRADSAHDVKPKLAKGVLLSLFCLEVSKFCSVNRARTGRETGTNGSAKAMLVSSCNSRVAAPINPSSGFTFSPGNYHPEPHFATSNNAAIRYQSGVQLTADYSVNYHIKHNWLVGVGG
ncbi:hypothetical protein PQR57_29470 [Paraburkholderia dipogonis]|uniref:Uncharacterized protein n=1 Tax=Paraburkholderia dipogonis TaxID=1211383 RepID=A0ABW9AX72_9BURK